MSRVALAVLLALSLGCGTIRNLGGANAKANAVQALVTTTRGAVLLMTAAGIAYDAGAFGEPGSARAEDTWRKISVESVRMGEALTAWSEAIKANKDASTYSAMVAQALAVIGALLPSRQTSELIAPDVQGAEAYAMLDRPDAFRRFAYGGAR